MFTGIDQETDKDKRLQNIAELSRILTENISNTDRQLTRPLTAPALMKRTHKSITEHYNTRP